VLKGAEKDEFNRGEPLYWHYPHYSNQGGPPAGGIRMGPWKLVERYENGEIELYNVEKDIRERKNLVEQHPDRARRMRAKLHEWYREVDARFLRAKGDGPEPWRPDYYESSPYYGAHSWYTFDDGAPRDDQRGAHPLNTVINGSNDLSVTDAGTLKLPGHDTASERDYLETSGPGATPAWTVSFWLRTSRVDQGKGQGLFSNNNDPEANYSWQVEVHNGALRLKSRSEGPPNPVLTNADAGEPGLQPNTWHHVVIRKTGNAEQGELYLGTRKGIEKVGAHDSNPGGLQMYRLGVNRTSNGLYQAEVANVSIFRNDTVSIDQLNEKGPFGN